MLAPHDTSDRPFGLPADSLEVVIDLPFPPSVNRIWRGQTTGNGGKRVRLSTEYKNWKKNADLVAIANGSWRQRKHVSGNFEAHIGLDNEAGRWGDLDNRVKAVLDWAQSRLIIDDDKHCRRLTVEWVLHACAPDGCRLTLRSMSA